MGHARQDGTLAFEKIEYRSILGVANGLDGDFAIRNGVPSPIHDPHATFAQEAKDLVSA
jgi:hypothetical protein